MGRIPLQGFRGKGPSGWPPWRWWFDLCPFLSLGLRYSPLSVVCFSRFIPFLFYRAAWSVDVSHCLDRGIGRPDLALWRPT